MHLFLPSRAFFSAFFDFYQETNTSLDINIQRGIDTFLWFYTLPLEDVFGVFMAVW